MPPNNVLLEHSCDYSFMYCSGRFHATMIELIVVAETALLTELKIFTVQFFTEKIFANLCPIITFIIYSATLAKFINMLSYTL